MKRSKGWMAGAIVLFSLAAIAVIVWIQNQSRPAPSVTGDMIRLAILRAEKQQDNSINVTAEITNQSCCTLADNRLFVAPMLTEGTPQPGKNGKNEGGGTAKADDPPGDTPVRELEGSFAQIPPGASVKIEFTVPSETALQEPLHVIFQTWKIRYGNTEETRAISVTEPLRISD
mgnify:CR=1 FL=1